MKYVYRTLIFLIFFTSSGDILFNPQIFGFSFRYTYFINIFLFMLFLFSKKSLKIKVLGLTSLTIWAIGEAIFIPNIPSFALLRNIGYYIWFIWNILYIVTFTYIADNNYIASKLFKDYLLSFILVAVYGFLQFFLYLFKIDLLLVMYWGPSFARINGFSYEPSYFATYLIIGWSILFYLYQKKTYVFNRLFQNTSFIFVSLVIVLSGSRMGLLVMVLILLIYILKGIHNDILKSKMSYAKTIIISMFFVSFVGAIVFFALNYNVLITLLQGTGLAGTATHSTGQRSLQMLETLQAFKASPFIGSSFGGIDIETSLIHYRGNTRLVQENDWTGMNIFIEQLVSAGILIYPFFVGFLYLTFSNSHRLYKKLILKGHSEDAIKLYALLVGLLTELILLCLNQNILRPYLWILIATINFYYFANKSKYNL